MYFFVIIIHGLVNLGVPVNGFCNFVNFTLGVRRWRKMSAMLLILRGLWPRGSISEIAQSRARKPISRISAAGSPKVSPRNYTV